MDCPGGGNLRQHLAEGVHGDRQHIYQDAWERVVPGHALAVQVGCSDVPLPHGGYDGKG